MSKVQVHTRGSQEPQLFNDDTIVTILDLKRRLNTTDPTAVLLTFKGKIITDSTPLSVLGEDLVFVMENEIEFSTIEETAGKTYKASINGHSMVLPGDNVFFKDGKAFMITRRKRKFKVKDLVEMIRKNVSRAQLLHLMFLAVVVVSKNYPLMVVVLTVCALRGLSYAFVKSKMWKECKGHLTYSAFMFFASMLSIDHEKFVRKD